MTTATMTARGLKPAVGYLRRSTDRQEQSIGDQRKAIERYAQEHGFDVLHFYIDDAISGTSTEARKAFQELIEDAKERDCPFKFVLTYDVKRFGRVDNDEAGHYRFTLRKRGVEIIYVAEGFNGDDTDDLLRPVKQWQARQESKDLSLVTIRGQLTRIQAGLRNGGTPPYGYDLVYHSSTGAFILTLRYLADGSREMRDAQGQVVRTLVKGDVLPLSKADRCTLTPGDPAHVQVIRDIFTWYTRDGYGFRAIAERLNKAGVPSPRGGNWSEFHGADWSMTTIRDILLNPVYTGDLVWNRLTFAKFHKIADGKAVRRHALPGAGAEQNPEEEWIIVRDAHPALITREQFELARTRREARRKGQGLDTYRVGRGATSPYLLSGLIQCDRCGHYWQGYSITKGKPRADGTKVKTRYYACNGYVSKGNAICRRSVIGQDALENWVLDQIDDILQRYVREGGGDELRSMIRQELQATASREEAQSDVTLEAIAARQREISEQVSAVLGSISEANRAFVNAHLESLRLESEDLTRQEEHLRRQAAQREMLDAAVEAQYSLACQRIQMARNVLLAGSIDEQRLIIRAFLRKIRFDPDTRTGTAEFWLVPGTGNEDPRRNPAGRGRRTDVARQAAAEGPDAQATAGVVEQRTISFDGEHRGKA